MDLDFPHLQISQPFLFDYADVITNAVELFPAVWSAAEDLTSPDLNLRRSGLARLRAVNAPRVSPLVAYLVACRTDDTDPLLRKQIVETISELLLPDEDGFSAPENVRRHLLARLASLPQSTIQALLETTTLYPEMDTHLFQILKVSPQASQHLCDILAERQLPIAVRKQAVHFIGQVGFLDALPTLERLATRLEARLTGQQSMAFAGSGGMAEEAELLPAITRAIGLLKAP